MDSPKPYFIFPIHHLQYYMGYMIVSPEDKTYNKLTMLAWIVNLGCMLDNWRVRQNLAVKFMETAKKYGGDVTIVKLPEVGIKGNTHFMFADLNNTDIAEHLEKWIKDRKLDR